MKSFRFPLETLLHHRRDVEETRKRTLAAARRLVLEIRGELDGLGRECRDNKAAFAAAAAGILDLPALLVRQRYLRGLDNRLRAAAERLARQSAEEEARRQAVVRASQDRRALELLRERRLERWRYDSGREEQKFLDEVSLRRARAIPACEEDPS